MAIKNKDLSDLITTTLKDFPMELDVDWARKEVLRISVWTASLVYDKMCDDFTDLQIRLYTGCPAKEYYLMLKRRSEGWPWCGWEL